MSEVVTKKSSIPFDAAKENMVVSPLPFLTVSTISISLKAIIRCAYITPESGSAYILKRSVAEKSLK